MTVVFDDPDLYRRVKIRAAEEGVPVKVIIERALRALFGEAGIPERPPRFSAETWFEWQQENERLEGCLGPSPDDLSDVKHHLYGHAPRPGPRREVAEESQEYQA